MFYYPVYTFKIIFEIALKDENIKVLLLKKDKVLPKV